jgi:hypothetical protein
MPIMPAAFSDSQAIARKAAAEAAIPQNRPSNGPTTLQMLKTPTNRPGEVRQPAEIADDTRQGRAHDVLIEGRQGEDEQQPGPTGRAGETPARRIGGRAKASHMWFYLAG